LQEEVEQSLLNSYQMIFKWDEIRVIGSQIVVAEVLGGVHVLVVLEHPLCAVQVGDVLLHVRHYLVYVLALGQGRVVLLLVEVIL
jgi:hypothetical protein